MRALLKHLPLLLTLLIPLGLLAWLGSRELSRLKDRSVSVLKEEAHRFLTDEEKRVRGEIERLAKQWLYEGVGTLMSKKDLSVVEASSQIGAKPFILQSFVVDEDFNLIAPRPPQAKPPSAPLSTFPRTQDIERELLRASILTDLKDYDGAVSCYDSYISRHRSSRDHNEGLMWAYFRLAALYDLDDDEPDIASNTYFSASLHAEAICQREPTEDAAAVMLLSDLRQAQINLNRDDDLIRVLDKVCTGQQDYIDYIADDLLDWVVGEIVQDIRADSDPRYIQRRDRALELKQTLDAGRRFATEYELHARSRLRFEKAGGRRYEHEGVIFHALTTDEGTRLLVMRPSLLAETNRFDGSAAWIGLILDLPGLLGSRLAVTPTSTPGNVALSVNDSTGVALLPVVEGIESNIVFTPVVSRLAGLEFVAIPITDPVDIQPAIKNQAILGLILVVVAAAAAFLLIRSVKRETELAQMKVLLLSRVSHELKTPLAVIKMYGETLGLGRTKDEGQVTRFADIITTEADRLTNMVERILSFSQMEAGTFIYEKERIDIGKLVEAVTEEYLPHVEAQGLHLVGNISVGLHADVDPRGLASSLVNLLENALKYTPNDAPERSLDVSVERRNGSAVLEVSDRGVGIPVGEHDKIFEDFYRASNAGEARGAGLGLSMVDHFARSHNGKVEALSRPDGGTTVRITLPLANAPESSEASDEES